MTSTDSPTPRRSSPATAPPTGLRVSARLIIPRGELVVRVSRASGAGGQHVNKTSSRVEVVWNVNESAVVNDAQRALLLTRLASKLTDAGELRVVASDTRSQLQNRELAEERLVSLIKAALIVPKVRKATKPTRSSKEARLESKKRTTNKKRERRWRGED